MAHFVVVGGGQAGASLVAKLRSEGFDGDVTLVCAKRGLNVTLVEMAERILQRVAAPETSGFFRDLHQAHGVTIREGVGLDRFLGDDHITGALLSDGTELEVDFAVVGVGIMPATTLAAAAGLTLDNGIYTDVQCRTSDPSIWAAGDCASCLFKGERIRLESVGNAIDMAEVAARNMMGQGIEYQPAPWFWSDQ